MSTKNKGIGLGYADVKLETSNAVLFKTDEYGDMWVPKSQIHDDSDVWNIKNNKGTLVVSEWFARQKGLL